MKKRDKIIYSIVAILSLWIVITNIVMAFNNPEMTQTELFLHIPKTFLLNFK